MKSFFQDLLLIKKGLREIHTIRPNLLLLISVRSIFQALTPFINIYMSARILNGIVDGMGFNALLRLALVTVLLNFLVMLILYLFNHTIGLLQSEFNSLYEMRLSLKVASLDYVDVESSKTHMMRQKITELKNMNGGGIWRLFNSFQVLIRNGFTIVFAASLTVSLFFPSQPSSASGLFSFIVSPWVSLLLILFIFVNVWVSMYANGAVTKKMYTIMNGMIPFNRIFGFYMDNYISTYHAGKDIRIYHQEKLISGETNRLFSDFGVIANRLARNQVKYATLTSVSTVIVSTLIYLFVGLKALAGIFGVGMIVQYVSSINEFTNGFTAFMGELSTLRVNNEAMKAYFEFMTIPAKMDQGTLSLDKNVNECQNTIEFRNVSFHYPDSDIYVLKNINLTFTQGKRVAVVGENGSGKTTMIKLMCRLYEPTEGEILLNGTNIKEYAYDEYLKLFSIVFQDFKLFSFSLVQNVSACSEYDPDTARECLVKSGFGERLSQMPDGIDTYLYKDFEENGIEISGGEAQKIALARALYKNAPFVVLDEPTAALDPIAEAEIYTRFNDIVGQKTAIYISHRLSSCRFCDTIFVFHKGELVQQGTHDELSDIKDGKYYKLWNAQAQYYAEE